MKSKRSIQAFQAAIFVEGYAPLVLELEEAYVRSSNGHVLPPTSISQLSVTFFFFFFFLESGTETEAAPHPACRCRALVKLGLKVAHAPSQGAHIGKGPNSASWLV